MTLRRCLATAALAAVAGAGVLATAPAQADEAAASAANCVWRVTDNGAPVWAKNGHGDWYVHHRKEKGSRVKGPAGEGPDWVKVYLGSGGEGLMYRWNLRLRSGGCR
jgi:hypothetical protein